MQRRGNFTASLQIQFVNALREALGKDPIPHLDAEAEGAGRNAADTGYSGLPIYGVASGRSSGTLLHSSALFFEPLR